MLNIEQFSESYLKPAAHKLVRQDAANAGLSLVETEALVAAYDADPIRYAEVTRGILGD